MFKFQSSLKLFKAVPITEKKKQKISKKLLGLTVPLGFVFSEEVCFNHSEEELKKLLPIISKEIGLTAEKANASFHKSWDKVKNADILTLVLEQTLHYFTTYGFESLGIYNENTVYIPYEKLEIPELKNNIPLTIIRGYTKSELKDKLLKLLNTGIALKKETIDDVVDLAMFVDIKEEDLDTIKNKEVKINLYTYLDIMPKSPIEFLRYIIFRATSNTLIIKNKATIETIKLAKNLDVLGLFLKYKKLYGLEKLAEIFYRYKPLWLAFKTNRKLSSTINKIRKLAYRHHKPMKEDYLNNITALIKNGKVDLNKLSVELEKSNIFRKIRLAYALKYRTSDVDSILYRVRNGKGWATSFDFENKEKAERIYELVLASIIKSISKKVKGKTIYIPDNIKYTLPATEKQFVGYFPSGTCVSVPKDMVFGVHWENTNKRVDLDLSLTSLELGKIGWDAKYRDEGGNVLFSGDITDAPKPKGASELFYISKQSDDQFIVMVNYFNHDENDDSVPFKILVAQEAIKNIKENYTVNPNNIKAITTSEISNKQKMLGLIATTKKEAKFYYAEANLGVSITSYSDADYIEHARNYLINFYENTISLNEVLKKAGAKIINKEGKCDIDLNPESIEKDTIINLLI